MKMFPSDPIAAVTHPDPYPYYADLVARTPVYCDDTLGLWVAASAEAVTFGVGAHACPGAALAATIAQAGVAAVIASSLDVMSLADGVSYRPSANARIPVWKETTE